MKKWVITTIFSLSAIFLMMNNVSAYDYSRYYDYEDINTSGISSLSGYTSRYIITYGREDSNDSGRLYLYMINGDVSYARVDSPQTMSDYTNNVCLSIEANNANGCFFRVWSSDSGNKTFSRVYYSEDLGNTWVEMQNSNTWYNYPSLNAYVIGLNRVTLRDYSNSYIVYPRDYRLELPNEFTVTYEQGEVVMADYESSTANLVTQYIETDLNTYDYIFSYSTNTGGGGGFRDSQEYEPICTENLVDDTIHYSCYYNIPLFYNTTLTFYITNKNTNEVVYQEDYVAYLSSLPDTDYYTIYELNNYKYANISNIDSGTFGVSDSISEDIAIYITDKTTGDNIDFITSEYYVSTRIENGVKYRTFDFNGNTNLYLTLEIKNNELWNNSTDTYYLFSPTDAYTHLSGMANLEENQDNPVNQQAYKDENGNIHYINNPISYDDYDNNFYSQSNNVIKGTLDFVKGTTNILTTFITSLDTPIQYTIYACFSFLLIAIVIMLFKH